MCRLYRLSALAVVSICLLAEGQSTVPRNQTLDETAKLIGVQSEITNLRSYTDAGQQDGWQILRLHQHIFEHIMAASLQVDATIAQIDNEIVRANELRGYLSDRRDRVVTRANLFGIIVGGGIGATSSGLQLSSSLDKPAAAVGISAGVLSAGLGLYGIHAQQGETSHFDFNSNMLAEFFDRPILPNSHYPAIIVTFLDQVSPYGPVGVTRRQDLIQTWIQVKRIDSLASTQKIDHVTSQPPEQLRLSIDDLADRAAMLEDVRARIAFLKRDLGALLDSLPPIPESAERAEDENKDVPSVAGERHQ
jgi:hypothetical protein